MRTIRSLQPIPRAIREAPEPVKPAATPAGRMKQKALANIKLAERYKAQAYLRVVFAASCGIVAGYLCLTSYFVGPDWLALPALPLIVAGLYFSLKVQAILRQRGKLVKQQKPMPADLSAMLDENLPELLGIAPTGGSAGVATSRDGKRGLSLHAEKSGADAEASEHEARPIPTLSGAPRPEPETKPSAEPTPPTVRCPECETCNAAEQPRCTTCNADLSIPGASSDVGPAGMESRRSRDVEVAADPAPISSDAREPGTATGSDSLPGKDNRRQKPSGNTGAVTETGSGVSVPPDESLACPICGGELGLFGEALMSCWSCSRCTFGVSLVDNGSAETLRRFLSEPGLAPDESRGAPRQDSAPALLPCPFCGGVDDGSEFAMLCAPGIENHGGAFCVQCPCGVRTGDWANEEYAAKQWNKRLSAGVSAGGVVEGGAPSEASQQDLELLLVRCARRLPKGDSVKDAALDFISRHNIGNPLRISQRQADEDTTGEGGVGAACSDRLENSLQSAKETMRQEFAKMLEERASVEERARELCKDAAKPVAKFPYEQPSGKQVGPAIDGSGMTFREEEEK